MQKEYFKHTKETTFLVKILKILKILNFAGITFCNFYNFWPFLQNSGPAKSFKTTKSRNSKPAKLNTCWAWDLCFLIFDQILDNDTCISHLFTYSNEIRVSVTYLTTITLINNRKIDIQWDFPFLFLMKLRN